MQDIYDRIEELERQNDEQRKALIAILTHLAVCDVPLHYTVHNKVVCPKCNLLIEDNLL